MSLIRLDVTTNDWVIFAPERTQRPHEVVKRAEREGGPASQGPCPFCPGNERTTPAEIYALRKDTAPNTPGWSVRVIPNKFPALQSGEASQRLEEGRLFHFMGGCGAHEVLIESPDHDRFLGQQPVGQVEQVLSALRARFNELLRDPRFQTVVLFKNHGPRAGTSLRHPHWQIIATPVVPRLLRLKHAVATDYFDRTGRCLYCVMLGEEMADGRRVLAENEHYAAVLPYASRLPFETWLLPRNHLSSFGRVDRLRPLAELLRAVLQKLYVGLHNPDFNLIVNTVPRGDEDKEYFLWHIEILPRLSTPAGFEMGSGMAINTVMPEEATAYLRDVNST